jgi:hypothetical protein
MTKEEIEVALSMSETIIKPERHDQFSPIEKSLARALLFVHKNSAEALGFYENVKHYDDNGAPGRAIFHRTPYEGDQYDFEPDFGARARLALDDIGATG